IQWQDDFQHGAPLGAIVQRYAAAMTQDDLPGDRKPDAEPLIVQIVFRAGPEKSFEHLILITFNNARAIVLYSDDHVPTLSRRFHGDGAARRRMLDGVVEPDD